MKRIDIFVRVVGIAIFAVTALFAVPTICKRSEVKSHGVEIVAEIDSVWVGRCGYYRGFCIRYFYVHDAVEYVRIAGLNNYDLRRGSCIEIKINPEDPYGEVVIISDSIPCQDRM